MSITSIDLSLDKILDVWADLEAALYGRNGYGGTVTEIYAYQCVNSAAADFDNNRDRNAIDAGTNLTEILRRFVKRHQCMIGFETSPCEFTPIDGCEIEVAAFDYRIHLEVVDTSRLGQDARFVLATATGQGLYDLVAKAFGVRRNEAKRRMHLATMQADPSRLTRAMLRLRCTRGYEVCTACAGSGRGPERRTNLNDAGSDEILLCEICGGDGEVVAKKEVK